MSTGTNGGQGRPRTKGIAAAELRRAAAEAAIFKLVQRVLQGEAGRDGLGLAGPPGPPGPPGSTIDLQDVKGEKRFSAGKRRTILTLSFSI